MRGTQCWLTLFLLVGVSCGGGSSNEALVVGKRTAAVTTPVSCKRPKQPGTDPKKPTTGLCVRPQIVPVPAAVGAQQQAYLAAWKAQAPTWVGLSNAQQENKRRLLKESFLGKGGQP